MMGQRRVRVSVRVCPCDGTVKSEGKCKGVCPCDGTVKSEGKCEGVSL